MDKLQWFKFAPGDWMMGKIMRCDEITQARYMRLVCLYWNKECYLSYEDAEIEIDKEHLDILIKKKIVKIDNDFINIEFLDEQMDGIIETSAKRRDAVNKRWKKVKEKQVKVIQTDTSVLQNDTEESRGEEKREEKITTIYNNFVTEVKNGGFVTRIESLYMRLKLKPTKLTPLLKDFKLHIIEENRLHKDTNDFFINFKNWLNVQDRNKLLDKYK